MPAVRETVITVLPENWEKIEKWAGALQVPYSGQSLATISFTILQTLMQRNNVREVLSPEQKAEHFPNLFNRFFVPLDTSEDDSTDSECEEGFCEGVGRLVTELPLVLLLRSLRMSRQGSPR